MLGLVHAAGALGLIGLSWRLADRDAARFAVLFFAVIYFLFFALAPILEPGAITWQNRQVLGASVVFLCGATLSTFFLAATARKRRRAPRRLEMAEAIAVSHAGQILAWLSIAITLVHFARAGVPWLLDDPQMARHRLAGSGYVQIFLTRALPVGVLAVFWAERFRTGKVWSRLVIFYVVTWFVLTFLQGFRVHLAFAVLYLLALTFFVDARMSNARLTLSGVAILAAFVWITGARSGDFTSFDIVGALRHRIGFELIWTAGYSMSLAELDGFWFGRSIVMDLHSALPGPGLSYGDYLLLRVAPQAEIVGLAALTPSVIGEAFLNFGYPGVLVYGLTIPVLISVSVALARRDRLLGPVVAAMVPILLTQVVQVGVGQVLASRLLPLLVFLVFLRFCVTILLRRQRGSREVSA